MASNALRKTHLLNGISVGWNRIEGWSAMHKIFQLLCTLTTLALVIWCGIEFNKNEDVCEILFKTFHEDKDSIYPELTFAVPNRFNETALREYDKGFNEFNYFKFLEGEHWDDKMLDADFEKVSMRIKDYIIESCFYETYQDKLSNNCKSNEVIKPWNNLGRVVVPLHFPSDMIMWSATIMLRNSIFYNGLRPANGAIDGIEVYFAYPNQLYRSGSSYFHK